MIQIPAALRILALIRIENIYSIFYLTVSLAIEIRILSIELNLWFIKVSGLTCVIRLRYFGITI
jgi:hypothetical protein